MLIDLTCIHDVQNEQCFPGRESITSRTNLPIRWHICPFTHKTKTAQSSKQVIDFYQTTWHDVTNNSVHYGRGIFQTTDLNK
jgi:hypothetical protein